MTILWTWRFTVKIQKFGGAGVGHWTLQNTKAGHITCYELWGTVARPDYAKRVPFLPYHK